MTKEEINNRLSTILEGLKSQWSDADITSSSNLREDLGLESLDYIDLVLQCETMFNITITPEEGAKAQTVADLTRMITEKLQ